MGRACRVLSERGAEARRALPSIPGLLGPGEPRSRDCEFEEPGMPGGGGGVKGQLPAPSCTTHTAHLSPCRVAFYKHLTGQAE